MTVCLTVLYPPPSDADEFFRRYRDEHVPLVNDLLPSHGLVRWSVGRTLDALDRGRQPTEVIANLYFDAEPRDVLEALESPAGQRLAAHALSIADGGMISYLSVVEEWAFERTAGSDRTGDGSPETAHSAVARDQQQPIQGEHAMQQVSVIRQYLVGDAAP